MSRETLVSPQAEQMQLPPWTIDIVRGDNSDGQIITEMPLVWQSDGSPRLRIVGVTENFDISRVQNNVFINPKTQLSFMLPEVA